MTQPLAIAPAPRGNESNQPHHLTSSAEPVSYLRSSILRECNMSEILDTVLLLALPASGKSEVRKYLDQLDPIECARDFHLGPTVQLDDFPYVHMMRRTDDLLRDLGKETVFFRAADKPFKEPLDWGTLTQLVNEDFEDMKAKRMVEPASAALWLLERLDAARAKVGAPRFLAGFDGDTKTELAAGLEREARDLLGEKQQSYPDTLDGKTLVIEFARGGPAGSSLPLPEPFGYAYSLAQVSSELLANAAVLYIWVTPEESRRKNDARADPDDPGSILHHGVPIDVMLGDYGCDDMEYLIGRATKPNHMRIEAHGKTIELPVARFDNRVDKTSFIRDDRSDWSEADIAALHAGLAEALTVLHRAVGN